MTVTRTTSAERDWVEQCNAPTKVAPIGTRYERQWTSSQARGIDGSYSSVQEFPGRSMANVQRAYLLPAPEPLGWRVAHGLAYAALAGLVLAAFMGWLPWGVR